MNFSIADLEQLSGVSTHTIRKWEQRYNALSPVRSSGNTRVYDDVQLKRLLNIVSLTQKGLPVSKVCALGEQEMDSYLEKELRATVKASDYEYYISRLISSGLDYKEYVISKLLNECIIRYGIKETYNQVMYPLLTRLGLMWQCDKLCPSQEHFLTAIIRQKIIAATEALPDAKNSGQKWLLFLPEDEDHEIGLLFANFILRMQGQKVFYLGSKVPLSNVKSAFKDINANKMLLFMVKSRQMGDARRYVEELTAVAGSANVFISGNGKLISKLELENTSCWLRSLADLEQIISECKYDC